MKLKMKMKVFGNFIAMLPGEAQILVKCNTKNKMYETHNLNILISINKVWIILHCFSSLNLDIPLNKFMSPLAHFFPFW